MGAPKRIALVAADLVAHFEKRLGAMDGKAMIVCMSRRICVDLYKAIIKLRPGSRPGRKWCLITTATVRCTVTRSTTLRITTAVSGRVTQVMSQLRFCGTGAERDGNHDCVAQAD